MGLAKKGSCAITVVGHRYRWAVSPDSGFMDLVIQDASGQGQRVSIAIDYGDKVIDIPGDPGRTKQVQTRQITPALVKSMILRCLALGWKPSAKGGSVRFHLKGDELTRQ